MPKSNFIRMIPNRFASECWLLFLLLEWLVSLVIQETSRLGARGSLQAALHHGRVLSGFYYEPHRPATG